MSQIGSCQSVNLLLSKKKLTKIHETRKKMKRTRNAKISYLTEYTLTIFTDNYIV